MLKYTFSSNLNFVSSSRDEERQAEAVGLGAGNKVRIDEEMK